MPQKIDDFDASSQVQLAGLGRVDENMPEWAGEETRREMASKGRFYGAHEFCNCLLTYKLTNFLPSKKPKLVRYFSEKTGGFRYVESYKAFR